MPTIEKEVLKLSKSLSNKVSKLSFEPPVHYCYNPLSYAWLPFSKYVTRYASSKKQAIFLGMNPGPFGMAQTGIPFGEIAHVRDWLEICEPVKRPSSEHPKRPIDGFNCQRSEVSGRRLWGWAKERFVTTDDFFSRFFIWNYCPLCFMGESGKNITPDKLQPSEREELFDICDQALLKLTEILEPTYLIGVGKFAQNRAKLALSNYSQDIRIETVLHPSPASPAANRGWAIQAEKQLQDMGINF